MSFTGGKNAVTIGRCPLHSIVWLQGKFPLSFGILRILQEFKSQKLSNTSQCSLPFPLTIPQNMSGYKCVHNFHRPLETSQDPQTHRLEWRFLEPAKETTWRCDPEQVLAYSTQAAQQACLVRTQQAKSGQKQRQKKQSRTWCCSQKEKNGTYKIHPGDPWGQGTLRLPSQCSLPLQELSFLQMGHPEWCVLLVREPPRTLFQKRQARET